MMQQVINDCLQMSKYLLESGILLHDIQIHLDDPTSSALLLRW